MALSVSIRDVKSLEAGLWKARLAPADLQFLGAADSRVGPLSVLLISEDAIFDRTSRTLSFNPGAARLLNLGTGEEAVIVQSRPGLQAPSVRSTTPTAGRVTPGDSRFVSSLSTELREFGTALLQAVRAEFPGELKFFERSGKFVETPDNFWTVRIQARDASFRITVRGRPESFTRPRSLTLKPDMTGYSSFKVSSPTQLEEFMSVLRQVPKKDRRG